MKAITNYVLATSALLALLVGGVSMVQAQTLPPSIAVGTGALVGGSEISLNVRSSPTTTATVVGTEPSGATAVVVGGPVSADGFTWWNLDYANGLSGWSVSNYLTWAQAPSPSPVPSPTPTPTPTPNPTPTPAPVVPPVGTITYSSALTFTTLTAGGTGSTSTFFSAPGTFTTSQ